METKKYNLKTPLENKNVHPVGNKSVRKVQAWKNSRRFIGGGIKQPCPVKPCERCGQTGEITTTTPLVWKTEMTKEDYKPHQERCPDCDGWGWIRI